MGNVIPFGFQGEIRFIEEVVVGTFPTNPALLLFSAETQRVRMFLDKNLKESVDIGTVDVHEFFTAQNSYGFEVEFHVYDVDRFFNFWERTTGNAPRAYSAELIPDAQATTKHWIRGTGWKTQTAKLSGRVGEAYVATVVFTGGKWASPVTADPGIGTGSRELRSAIVGALRTFAGGVITIDGSAAAIIVEEFEVTVDHGTEPKWTAGSADPVPGATSHKHRKISGTLNMSLDDGFKEHFDRVNAFADAVLVVPFGAAGQPKVTFSGVKFPKFEGEVSIDADILMGSQPWNAETYAEGVV